MSEQQQGTPDWHAIVGEGWKPVQFGEETRHDDQVLIACGWVDAACDIVSVSYRADMRPRRRRKGSCGIQSWKIGADCWLIKGASPGDRFELTEDGRMIPVDKPPTESAE